MVKVTVASLNSLHDHAAMGGSNEVGKRKPSTLSTKACVLSPASATLSSPASDDRVPLTF